MNPYRILGLREDATFQEVVEAFRKLAKQHHPDKASNEEERRKNEEKFILITEAYNAIKSGTIPHLQQAADRESAQNTAENTERIILLAEQSIKSKNYDAAIRMLKNMNKKSEKIIVLLGEAYFRKKRYHEALRCFKKLSDYNPWNLEARFRMALIYEEINLPATARKIYEEILKLDSSNTKALNRLQRLKTKKYFNWSGIFSRNTKD